jgi:hypothetical protein
MISTDALSPSTNFKSEGTRPFRINCSSSAFCPYLSAKNAACSFPMTSDNCIRFVINSICGSPRKRNLYHPLIYKLYLMKNNNKREGEIEKKPLLMEERGWKWVWIIRPLQYRRKGSMSWKKASYSFHKISEAFLSPYIHSVMWQYVLFHNGGRSPAVCRGA